MNIEPKSTLNLGPLLSTKMPNGMPVMYIPMLPNMPYDKIRTGPRQTSRTDTDNEIDLRRRELESVGERWRPG